MNSCTPLPFFLFSLALAFATGRAEAGSEKPNFILCMADDQGWGDVGYAKGSIARTPVLDEMAASGLRFDRFYAAHPVCSPTRGSVLTGRNPNRYGCFSWGHSIRPEEITIAEALKQAGYTTGHFGKWHVGSVDPRSDVNPGASGFDRWFSSPNFYDNDPLMSDNGTVVETRGESSVVTMEAAIEFIRDCHRKEEPFLAVVWFGSPHNPHEAIPEDRAPFANKEEKLQHYYGEILGIDRSMGMLRRAMRELGLAENTLLWYTSDNGPQGPKDRGIPGSSGGLRDRKGTVWEGGIRVPTIIEWPARIPEPRITNVTCNSSDIYPTLLAVAGLETGTEQPVLDGINLLPLIEGKMSTRPEPMGFWHFPSRGTGMKSRAILAAQREAQRRGEPLPLHNDPESRSTRISEALAALSSKRFSGHAAWIDGRFKLHRIPGAPNGEVAYELYDLAEDAAETKNLADEMPARAETMRDALRDWQESVVRSLEGDDYVE